MRNAPIMCNVYLSMVLLSHRIGIMSIVCESENMNCDRMEAMHIETCEYCNGSGLLPILGTNKMRRCISCKGTGKIEQEEEEKDEREENGIE